MCAFPIDTESVVLAVGTDTLWLYGAEEDQFPEGSVIMTSFVFVIVATLPVTSSRISIFSFNLAMSIKSVLSGLFSFRYLVCVIMLLSAISHFGRHSPKYAASYLPKFSL